MKAVAANFNLVPVSNPKLNIPHPAITTNEAKRRVLAGTICFGKRLRTIGTAYAEAAAEVKTLKKELLLSSLSLLPRMVPCTPVREGVISAKPLRSSLRRANLSALARFLSPIPILYEGLFGGKFLTDF